jgi:hypothetical protein
VFDTLTLYAGQKYLQLPILEAWHAMWQDKFRFFGFLLYGLATMGLIGVCVMFLLYLKFFTQIFISFSITQKQEKKMNTFILGRKKAAIKLKTNQIC